MNKSVKNLDDLDLRLLGHLQRQGDVSNHALAIRVEASAATCLRRVQRLKDAGYLQRTVTLLNPDRLAGQLGHGLTAVVEVTLDKQGEEYLTEFENRVAQDPSVTQCYRVSPGPDFVIMAVAEDMPSFLAMAQRLFTQHANVRNVKTYFSVKQTKFEPRVPQALPL
jgi:Lrp/AsnC family leucine-responsive transcriptional regulator